MELSGGSREPRARSAGRRGAGRCGAGGAGAAVAVPDAPDVAAPGVTTPSRRRSAPVRPSWRGRRSAGRRDAVAVPVGAGLAPDVAAPGVAAQAAPGVAAPDGSGAAGAAPDAPDQQLKSRPRWWTYRARSKRRPRATRTQRKSQVAAQT